MFRRAPWNRPPEEDLPVERGAGAVLHASDMRGGRRSADFPDINITATAQKLGVTKSHLAKVLAGKNRPSVGLALRLAEVLGKDVNYVAALYKKR